jgi:hypothetical protein
MTRLQNIPPDPAGAIGAITVEETLADLLTDRLVTQAATAARACQLCIEPTAGDTERPAHHPYWPGPSVLRHEAELHVDSLAK